MEVKELGHLVLYVRNLDRSVAWVADDRPRPRRRAVPGRRVFGAV